MTVQASQKLRDLARQIGAIREFVRRPKTLTRQYARLMRSDARRSFINQVGPDGLPWKPSQAAIDEGRKTGLDTRTLFNSITSRSIGTKAIVTTGPEAPYAGYFQEGTQRDGKEVMPPRPFIGYGKRLEQEILRVTEKSIASRFSR